MEKHAVIQIGSRQYDVREGEVIEVERQKKPFQMRVLMLVDGAKVLVGDPEVKEAEIKIELQGEKRDDKIMVGRFKSKSRYDKKRGHRQSLSIFKIESIGIKGEEKAEKTEKVAVAKVKPAVKSEKKAQVKKVSKKLPKKETK